MKGNYEVKDYRGRKEKKSGGGVKLGVHQHIPKIGEKGMATPRECEILHESLPQHKPT